MTAIDAAIIASNALSSILFLLSVYVLLTFSIAYVDTYDKSFLSFSFYPLKFLFILVQKVMMHAPAFIANHRL